VSCGTVMIAAVQVGPGHCSGPSGDNERPVPGRIRSATWIDLRVHATNLFPSYAPHVRVVVCTLWWTYPWCRAYPKADSCSAPRLLEGIVIATMFHEPTISGSRPLTTGTVAACLQITASWTCSIRDILTTSKRVVLRSYPLARFLPSRAISIKRLEDDRPIC
jgi:hypothetical protein